MPLVFAFASFGLLAVNALEMIVLAFLLAAKGR
jgi:hypothetical protein